MAGYLDWHYREGLSAAWRTAIAGVIGVFNYFSVLELFSTLFSSWHRITDSYGRGFDPSRFFWILGGNIISRILGAVVRSAVILAGLASSVVALGLGMLWIVFWLSAPILIPLLMAWGFYALT